MYGKYFIAILDFWYEETFWIGEKDFDLELYTGNRKKTVLIKMVKAQAETREGRSLYVGGTVSLRLALTA